MTDQDKQLLYRLITLENARLIFDGIAELHHQLFAGIKRKQKRSDCRASHVKTCIDEIATTIEEEIESILTESYDLKTKEPLRQNVNFSFLAFWDAYFCEKNGCIKTKCHVISEMVLYFDLLQRLASPEDVPEEIMYSRDEIPYCYEKLCCYIRRILKCENCFVLRRMRGNAQIVCRSPYRKDEIEHGNELTARDLEALLERHELERKNLTDDIFQITEDKMPFVVICLAELDQQRNEELLLVLQQPDAFSQLEQNISPLTRVLFLRERLKEALVAQYEYLLNLRFDCGFVQFFKASPSGGLFLQYPSIMHISDIHMDIALHSRIDDLKHSLEDRKKDYGAVDLLVISGDLVDAKYSNASQIQNNYEYLKELLRAIVAQLWDRGDGRVSFDWRRRVLIVPGNHDFAAMNLFKAVFQYRAIAANIPAPGGNKIMAKFSYYLDFLQSFLDAPIDELMINSINEVREYRCMNTKVLLLNSSVGATAQRTNKVTLDLKAVEHLVKSTVWKKVEGDCSYRVCVVHHPPFHNIDYVLDGYDSLDEWKWAGAVYYGDMNSLYDAMKKAINEYQEERNGRVGLEDKEHYRNLFKQQYESMERKDIISNSLKKAYIKGKTYFTLDAKLFYDCLQNKSDANSEEATNMINRILYDLETAKRDGEAYDGTVDKIADADIFLCGHIHANEELNEVLPESAQEKRVSIIRKFGFDDWEPIDEQKAHFRMLNASQTSKGIRIEITSF